MMRFKNSKGDLHDKDSRRRDPQEERIIRRMEKGDYELNVEIILGREDPVYLAGETVSGDVVITTTHDVIITGIQIEALGMAIVEYDDLDERVIDDEVYVSEIMDLCYVTGEDIFGGVIIESGGHRFPFMTPLPAKLPASFHGEQGRVRYLIKSTVFPAVLPASHRHDDDGHRQEQRPDAGHATMTEFGVLNVADLNLLDPQYTLYPIACRQTRELQDRTDASVSWDVPRTGYAPGDVIDVYCRVRNDGAHRLGVVETALVQYVRYKRRDGTHHVEKRLVDAKRRHDIPAREVTQWEDAIHLPLLPPSGLTHCSLMDIWYRLEFYADGPGFGVPMTSSRDVIIGSIPLKTESMAAFHSPQRAEILDPVIAHALPAPPPQSMNGALVPYPSDSQRFRKDHQLIAPPDDYIRKRPFLPTWQHASPPDHWYKRHYAETVRHPSYQRPRASRDLGMYRTHQSHLFSAGRPHEPHPDFRRDLNNRERRDSVRDARASYTANWIDYTSRNDDVYERENITPAPTVTGSAPPHHFRIPPPARRSRGSGKRVQAGLMLRQDELNTLPQSPEQPIRYKLPHTGGVYRHYQNYDEPRHYLHHHQVANTGAGHEWYKQLYHTDYNAGGWNGYGNITPQILTSSLYDGYNTNYTLPNGYTVTPPSGDVLPYNRHMAYKASVDTMNEWSWSSDATFLVHGNLKNNTAVKPISSSAVVTKVKTSGSTRENVPYDGTSSNARLYEWQQVSTDLNDSWDGSVNDKKF